MAVSKTTSKAAAKTAAAAQTNKTTELSVTRQVVNTIQNMRGNLLQVLPPQINVDKFIRTACAAVQNDPKLLECDRRSLFMSCQRAAQDGLIIDGREAALVVFNTKDGNQWIKKAQYMPMTAGILKKARNSGDISTINAYVVNENDEFDYTLGLEPNISHVPNLENPGDFRLAYAVAKLKDGSIQLEVMTKTQIEKVRKISKSGAHKETGEPIGIWAQWYDEMARKTVLRRLCKYLPSSTDLEGVLSASDEAFDLRGKDDEQEQHQEQTRPAGKTRAESAILGDEDEPEGEAIEGEIVDREPGSDDDSGGPI